MCGISLSIAKNTVDIQAFKAFNTIVKHRGPNDEGFVFIAQEGVKLQIVGGADTPAEVWKTPSSYQPQTTIDELTGSFKVALGHRRLSILDLSAKGHLPMCDVLKRYWITYNGEIYNFIELKAELLQLGYQFSTESDTEVILAAYATWGSECLNRFVGMWAFAIYDTVANNAFVARDRYGIKPLYYWFSPEGDFYLGSEIKQFTEIPSWKAQLNPQRVYDYLFYAMTDHTEETMFKNVYSIAPGHSATLNTNEPFNEKHGKILSKKWYQPEKAEFSGTFAEACQQFNRHFDSAIDLHLRSDVPIGSALSGGLDSTAIVCSVNKKLKDQGVPELQKTFSSCSHVPEFDEKKWMDQVILTTKVDATFIYPEGEDVFKISEKIIWHQDEPYQSQSAFLAYNVFEAAKKNNVKVLMNGQGADEYMSGYNAFGIYRKLLLFKKGQFLKLYSELHGPTFLSKMADSRFIAYHLLPKKVIRLVSKFSSENRNLHAMIDIKILGARNKHPHDKKRFKFNSIFEIAHYQMLYEPLQKYLRWEDRNSMAHSVEARVPFLDHRLVEFTTSLPIDYLDGRNESKKIMVHGLSELLPEAIRNRKDKKGFITPEELWFKKDYSEQFIALFEKYNGYTHGILREKEVLYYFNQVMAGKAAFDYTYWRLISLGMWMKVFNVDVP
ncbi:MAG: asparagine synthase (glutamine-hydrolyzing) [Burkholderiales bacterium]|nr:asparagine synthase (glutamine-hydrolyzing) [Flavobacterium sp.]